jgi:peptidoglycan/LPS O-acetylase OafA/YrhL
MSGSPSSGYQPGIDGLRAVAVLAVLGFHAFPRQLPGGFLGVDVFFVISGFLISGIILRALDEGTFSFGTFYARRIKRIFPALIALLIVCLAVGWAFLLRDELHLLAKHEASGSAFVVNLVLSHERGYFDTSAEMKPLLHLWSLGIEEQFYLVWPLLLSLAHRFGRRVLSVIVVLGVLSFAATAERVSGLSHAVAFFHPAARFWELLMGAALAALALRPPRFSLLLDRKSFVELLFLVGLACIVVALLVFDQARGFPRWTVVPTFGAVLAIGTVSKSRAARVLLANRPMVAIGKISYPLYLWHWPLLSFARIFHRDEAPVVIRVALLGAAFILAAATYRWIERPIREPHGADTRSRSRRIVVLCSAAMTALFGVSLLICLGLVPPRLRSLDFVVDARADWDGPVVTRADRHPTLNISVHRLPGSSAETILFIGDSNIEQFYARAKKLWNDGGRSITVEFVTAGSCSPVPEIERVTGACRGFMADAYTYALEPQIKRIVIGATWDYFDQPSYRTKTSAPIPPSDGPAIFAEYAKRLQGLTSHGKEVFLVLPVPKGMEMDPSHEVDGAARLTGIPAAPVPLPLAPFELHYAVVTRLLHEVADSSGAHELDPVPELCKDGQCSSVRDGRPISKDAGHLRSSYVATYIRMLDPLFSALH